MIVRYLVVDQHGEAYGSPTMAPPSPRYMDTVNDTNVGNIVRRRQPFRVVQLCENLTYQYQGGDAQPEEDVPCAPC
jgi:hypothetical protein